MKWELEYCTAKQRQEHLKADLAQMCEVWVLCSSTTSCVAPTHHFSAAINLTASTDLILKCFSNKGATRIYQPSLSLLGLAQIWASTLNHATPRTSQTRGETQPIYTQLILLILQGWKGKRTKIFLMLLTVWCFSVQQAILFQVARGKPLDFQLEPLHHQVPTPCGRWQQLTPKRHFN